MEDLTGKQLDEYHIISPCGEGGMATVYKAYQANMDRYVAVKVLPRFHATNPEFIERFTQEARVLAKLQHPFVVPIHDFGEVDGYTYLVMSFIKGGTLTDWLTGEPVSLSKISKIISQVGSALAYAHSLGLVHRDIKPSNILIDLHGNSLLTDFGIAKILEGSAELTRTGGILGTPIYMSPEQGSGEKIAHTTDIYSLGVVLYEMVTGRAPFQAETPFAVIYKHIHDPLPPPSSINPSTPEGVERVILKALAKNPKDRFDNVQSMVDALTAAIPAEGYQLRREPDLAATQVEIVPEPAAPAPEVAPPDSVLPEVPVVEPAPKSVTDEREEPTGMNKFLTKRVMLLLGGVVAVAIAVISILNGFDFGGTDQGEGAATQEPTTVSFLAPEPTEDKVVEVQPTVTSEPTQRPTPIPASPTHAGPTSTPISVVPARVSNFLRNPVVEFHEPFNGYNRTVFGWNNENLMDLNYGTLTLYGDKFTDWGETDPSFISRQYMQVGEAVLISFQIVFPAEYAIYFDSGDWREQDYRRFGFGHQFQPDIIFGDSEGFDDSLFTRNISSDKDIWYYALIALGQNEDFSLLIWEMGNTSGYNLFRANMGADWRTRDWRLVVQANFGEIAFDDLTLISFDGYVGN